MDPDRWRQVEQLYHAAMEKDPRERALFLEQSCAGDASLREEIESLLAFAERAEGYLKAAVDEVASQASGVSAGALAQKDLLNEVPQKLGRYQLLEQIGKGGMGVVYRGIDPVIGRTVAIKTILIDENAAESTELRARLLRESQAAGRLSHPNIVAVHDASEQGQTAYIVMEYVAGRTLQQAMRDDASVRSTSEVLRVIQECAGALDYAHCRGVVHRDIKPANIMVQADGAVKIADFGIARIAQSTLLTQTASTIGSPHYMAPEQWRGEPVTGRADQYALAAVAYTMLTGRRPFEGDTMASLAAQTLYQEPPSATTYNSNLSPGVDDVLRRALSKTAAARYESCIGFADALRGVWENLPAASSIRRRSRRLAIGVTATLFVVLTAGAWLYYHRDSGAKDAANPQVKAVKSGRPPDSNPTPSTGQSKPPAKSKAGRPSVAHPVGPLSAGNPYAQAAAFLKRGAYAEAVPYFSKAIATNPDYRAYFGRAGAYQRLERPEQAIADYSQAIRLKPDSAMAYHDRAVCEARLNQNDRALDDYNQALELDSSNPRAWNGRGVIYLRRKEYASAIPEFTEAVRLDPAFAQSYENRARAKRALGDAPGAIADQKHATKLKSQQPSQ